jgi:phosphate acetyltransferase
MSNLASKKDLMEDVSYYGTMMVYQCKADGMVSGAVHTTQHTIYPLCSSLKPDRCLDRIVGIFYVFRRPSFRVWRLRYQS